MDTFTNIALPDLPQNLHVYTSCRSQSPVLFDSGALPSCSLFTPGPSPLSFASAERLQLEEGRSSTPSPCMQTRQVSPYSPPAGESAILGQDWCGLYTEGQPYTSGPWNPDLDAALQGALPQRSASTTVHHYPKPPTPHPHSGFLQHGSHFSAEVDLPACEIDCPRDLNGPLQHDGQATSSVQAASVQTPWKVKQKACEEAPKAENPTASQETDRKPRTEDERLAKYARQKALQRERERAIRDEFSKLHGLLPWSKDVAHSKRDILRNAISYIDTLENKIREIRRGMETVWTSCKEKSAQGAASYDNMASGFAKSKGTEAFADTKEEFSVAPEPLTPGMDCLAALLSSVGNGNVSTSKEKNRIKRPMNAFLLFSKKHRKIYQERYPGRDNRKISTLMAEDWNKMEEGTKKPYRDEAHEEMKKKRENPRFRYSETKKTPQGAVVRATEKDGSDGFRKRENEGQPVEVTDAKCIKFEEPPTAQSTEANETQDEIKPSEGIPDEPEELAEQTNVHGSEVRASLARVIRVETERSGRYHDNWAQCDVCHKWRMLSDSVDPLALPDKWFCWLNPGETCDDRCHAEKGDYRNFSKWCPLN